MKNIFLLFGYGIPKDILKDENYNLYLKMVFNKIHDTSKDKTTKSLIICCGGKTDMIKPYKRTEADEMIRFFTELIEQKPFTKTITKNWTFIGERNSLSTLENLLNSKKIIEKRKIKQANFFIFCEQTRRKRIKTLVKKIFNKNYNFQVLPIDFDLSPNRYLSKNFLMKKENLELKHALSALKSPENLKKHHKIFTEKIARLRKNNPKTHTEEIKKWWEEKLKELK